MMQRAIPLLLALLMTVSVMPVASPAQEIQTPPQRPDPNTFQTGDLIWPKIPGQFIPFIEQADVSSEIRRQEWEQQRDALLEDLYKEPDPSLRRKRVEDELSLLLHPAVRRFGDPSIYSGHVGMIFMEDGNPWVVEAVHDKVRTIRYKDWLEERPDADVWHARLKDISAPQRAQIAAEALRQNGKPYSLFNRNLDDDQAFYCSKLIWFAAFRALKLALDDDSDPNRLGWYTPKELLGSPYLDRLFTPTPGPYLADTQEGERGQLR
jgi:cell wall-associated NlpC family hydrolase